MTRLHNIAYTFNLYSEFRIAEALEKVKGMQFNECNITKLRYVDDTVLIAETKTKLQRMIDKLNKTCTAYGMSINVKKTTVMVVNKKSTYRDR